MPRSPAPPADLQVNPFSLGDETLVLVSYPIDEPHDVALSDAQREIFALLRLGTPIAEIAARRGTSPSTVRKQAAALYRALGVSGRSEFLGRFVRAPAR